VSGKEIEPREDSREVSAASERRKKKSILNYKK
jgi:hypothetical protein